MILPSSFTNPLDPKWRPYVALATFVATFLLLFFNQDAGFPKDESYYFRYARNYQNWIASVQYAENDEAREEALSKENTLKVWRGNAEHPPLAKLLFGASWRIFGRLDRPLSLLRQEDGGLRFSMRVEAAEGFREGATVQLLSPLKQGESVSAPHRVLAEGKVSHYKNGRVTVDIQEEQLSRPASFILSECQLNNSLDPSFLPITPCMAREKRLLSFLPEYQAFRLPGIASSAFAVMFTFLLGEAFFGWLAALFGAFLFILVPEHFFHGFLACFDMPVVASQMFTIYAFWRSLKSKPWAFVTAFAFGLAVLTKHNAFFVPVALGLFWLYTQRQAFALALRRRHFAFPRIPLAFFLMPLFAALMLYLFWPFLWWSPLESTWKWLQFHLEHEQYMQYWFGEALAMPPFPFFYPFEKSLLTYPESFTLLLILGLAFLLPYFFPSKTKKALLTNGQSQQLKDFQNKSMFLLINGFIPILVIAMPSTPIFGGIKHWMPGSPFLALIAAYGLIRLLQGLSFKPLYAVAIAALLLLSPLYTSLSNAWLGTDYYNSVFAGGLQGAADKKLMRVFWGQSSRYGLDWVNANAPYRAKVYWLETTYDASHQYQRESWLRHDLQRVKSPEKADIAVLEPLEEVRPIQQRVFDHFSATGPDIVVERQGVPYLYILHKKPLKP